MGFNSGFKGLKISEDLKSTCYHTSLYVFQLIYLLNLPYLMTVIIGWMRITWLGQRLTKQYQ